MFNDNNENNNSDYKRINPDIDTFHKEAGADSAQNTLNSEISGAEGFSAASGGPESDETHSGNVSSYTPPKEISFMPGYGKYTQYGSDVPADTQPAQKPYEDFSPHEKKKRTGKSTNITLGTIVSIALVCAIISSVCTSIAFMFAGKVGTKTDFSASSQSATASGSSDETVKQINVVESDSNSLIEAIAEKVSPSVVGIQTTSSVTYMFYGTTEQTGEGSGIVYSSDGYIITNYHVISSAVENDGKISVFLPTDASTAISAAVIGYDVSADLAVLKIDKTGLTPIEIGDSDEVKVGQTAVAIGNPGGLEFMGSVSAGIISGLNRTIQMENTGEYVNLIQTDAAINPGNSGGALVNSNGFLIGINSAKLASSSYEGMGFSIPSNTAIEICQRIITNVDEPQAYLGLEISSYYTSDRLSMMGYPSGVVIETIISDGPADKAGLTRGDIITAFNGTSVTSLALYNSEKQKYTPGQTVTLTVYRQGRSYDVKVTLGTANN